MRALLRSDLGLALKARDQVATSALRSALAALENAEAEGVLDAAAPGTAGAGGDGEVIAGSRRGVAAAEVERRLLGDAEVRALLEAQVTERVRAAVEYESSGHLQRAERLRAEAGVLEAYLGPGAGPVRGGGRAG